MYFSHTEFKANNCVSVPAASAAPVVSHFVLKYRTYNIFLLLQTQRSVVSQQTDHEIGSGVYTISTCCAQSVRTIHAPLCGAATWALLIALHRANRRTATPQSVVMAAINVLQVHRLFESDDNICAHFQRYPMLARKGLTSQHQERINISSCLLITHTPTETMQYSAHPLTGIHSSLLRIHSP